MNRMEFQGFAIAETIIINILEKITYRTLSDIVCLHLSIVKKFPFIRMETERNYKDIERMSKDFPRTMLLLIFDCIGKWIFYHHSRGAKSQTEIDISSDRENGVRDISRETKPNPGFRGQGGKKKGRLPNMTLGKEIVEPMGT